MSFPFAPILEADINLGSWTDVSNYIYQRNAVDIEIGRQNQASAMQSADATLTLNNRDGRWTIRNPVGAWYGSLVQNTPIRFSVPSSLAGLNNFLRLENDTASYASAPDGAPVVVQTAENFIANSGSANNTVTVTLPNQTTQNNCLVVKVVTTNGTTDSTVGSVTLGGLPDNFGSLASFGTGASAAITSFWADPSCAGGQTAVAVTTTGGSGNGWVYVYVEEVLGLAATLAGLLDKSAGTSSTTSSTSWSSGATATTTQANEFWTGIGYNGSASTITGPSSPWTNESSQGSAPIVISGYQVTTTTGAATYSGTAGTSGHWAAAVVTLKAATSGTSLQITSGTLSIRWDGKITDWVGNHVLMAKHGNIGKSWALWTNSDGSLQFLHTDSGGTDRSNQCLVALPYYGTRIAIRVDFNVSAGTVTFFTAPTMSGTWTQLGPVNGTTASLSAGSGQPIQIGAGTPNLPGMFGEVYEAQVLSSGTLVADPVFTSASIGAASFADLQGNTWTLGGTAELKGRLYRFHGELSSLPKTSDPTASDIYSDATASGIFSRMLQQTSPVNSAFYRALTRITGSSAANEYWSFEDGTGAGSLGSAVGGTAAVFTPALQLASFSGFACSNAVPTLNGGTITCTVRPYVATDDVVRFIMAVPSGGDSAGDVLMRYYTQGTIARADLIYGTGGTLTLNGFDVNGNQLFTSNAIAFNTNGALFEIEVALQQSGSNVTWHIDGMTPGAVFQEGLSGTVTSATIGAITQIIFNPGAGLIGTAVGHCLVQPLYNSQQLGQLASPLAAWFGETAASRIARLCSEESIPCRIMGPLAQSQAMGNQTAQTVANLLQECERTDMGFLFEPRFCGPGLGYFPLRSLYNQNPMVTASFSAAALAAAFQSDTDTQLSLNDVTFTATDGSFSRQVLSSGSMSINSPPNGIGRIDTEVQVNPASDSQLPNEANWFLRVRSIDEDRYSSIPFDQARVETPASVGLLDIGGYVQIITTPPWLPPNPIKQLAVGFSESIGPLGIWTISANGIPELPYEVAVVGVSHFGTDGSTLTTGITSTATSMSVTTAAGFAVWTQSAGAFPFNIMMGGELITVTNITSATSPQTFTIIRSVNGIVKSHNAGESIQVYPPPVLAL